MKKRNTITVILAILVVIFGTFGIVNAEEKAESTEPIIVKVGIPGALSGPAAPWGQIGIDAYYAFVELFNKQGGFKVNGKTHHFEILIIDDKNTPEGGAEAAKKLIYEDKVKFIAGHWSWNFPTVAKITNRAKVIFLTRTGNEAVPGGVYNPKKMPYTVFACPSHEMFINDLFTLVKAFPNYKKIGIYDSIQGKGIGWDYVYEELDKAGIKYHMEWYPVGTVAFAPYITRFAEEGCDILYGAGDITAAMLIAGERWEMGYKKWKIGTAGTVLDPNTIIEVAGYEAAQGFIGQYFNVWDFKKNKVNPKYVKMCKDVMRMVSKKQGKPFTYTGWIGWGPNHLLILAQAIEKAGTIDDPDKIMEAIRGGTFDTTIGTFTMSGEKTYGSPVVFGSAGALSRIKGKKEVYFTEYPLKPLP
ncbi:MAG: ABC transporter substrate-binding protein [Deltaproteobacteria bacterium]|nr:ABC transporter substrate-binding protein [Deltaproteobacteria bacterium]MBW1847445.1 ABC transporter substrate-binding protein [Deltaproteobacteria bacterium]